MNKQNSLEDLASNQNARWIIEELETIISKSLSQETKRFNPKEIENILEIAKEKFNGDPVELGPKISYIGSILDYYNFVSFGNVADNGAAINKMLKAARKHVANNNMEGLVDSARNISIMFKGYFKNQKYDPVEWREFMVKTGDHAISALERYVERVDPIKVQPFLLDEIGNIAYNLLQLTDEIIYADKAIEANLSATQILTTHDPTKAYFAFRGAALASSIKAKIANANGSLSLRMNSRRDYIKYMLESFNVYTQNNLTEVESYVHDDLLITTEVAMKNYLGAEATKEDAKLVKKTLLKAKSLGSERDQPIYQEMNEKLKYYITAKNT